MYLVELFSGLVWFTFDVFLTTGKMCQKRRLKFYNIVFFNTPT